jgi:threonine dehydrogenase-like Zn-dependent dehydrogenase
MSVIGAGTLGCLCAWLARTQYDADVELIDINPERAAIAAQLGVSFATPTHASAESPLVVHTSATEAGLQNALSVAGFEATIVELSWFGDTMPRLPLGEAFHSRRLTLKASQVGHVAAAMRGHQSRTSRLRMALRLLRDPTLDVLIDSHSSFDELPDVMAAFTNGSRHAICHRVHYD